MTSTWCPIENTVAETLVGDGYDKFTSLGVSTYKWTLDNLADFDELDFTPVAFDVDFSYADPQSTFNAPTRPPIDYEALKLRDPGYDAGAAPAFAPRDITLDAAPSFADIQAPTLSFAPAPAAPDISAPTEPAPSEALSMPVAPDYVFPVAPTLESLHLPVVPTIALPEYQGLRPVYVEPPFNESWAFDPAAYTERFVSKIEAAITPMIAGSQALPDIIERALFEKSRTRTDQEVARNVQQAYTEFAARGFDEPQGMLNGRIIELRQAGQNSVVEASRDVLIRQMELALEQQRFAIGQGAALEATLIQLYTAENQMYLAAAQFQRDSAVAMIQYRIQSFNAQLAAYQADSQVYRDLLQAELSKIEIYRAELEGQRLVSEINQQQIQIYTAMLQSVNTRADIYRTMVEAVKVQADVQMQEIEKYKARVDAYNSRYQAYATEWQGYTASVNGQQALVDIYRTRVDAQARRVDAWATKGNMEISLGQMDLQEHNMKVEVWKQGLEKYRLLLGAEQARIGAQSTAVQAEAQMYTADASVASTASAAADRSFELGLEREKSDVETQLKTAQMAIEQAEFALTQSVEIIKAKSQVASQLSASALSAVNLGAQVQTSRSRSCNTSFSFSGEPGDA
jgi:hypothetical protein